MYMPSNIILVHTQSYKDQRLHGKYILWIKSYFFNEKSNFSFELCVVIN